MITRKGFTLIELLVVIAIIAILAAILFPVFAKAREKARQTACLSNEKQIGLAFMQYAQDNDERLPAAWDNGRSPHTNWAQMIYPYVKSLQAFVCPSNPVSTTSNALMGESDGQDPKIPASYAMNADLGFQNGDIVNGQNDYGSYHGIANIASPSIKVLVTESQKGDAHSHWPDWWQCGGGSDCTSAAQALTSSPIVQALYAGHTGRINVIYCDGHAKSMKPIDLVTPVSQFGQLGSSGSYAGSDINCNMNPTGQDGVNAINCDTPNPSAVFAAQALQQKYQ